MKICYIHGYGSNGLRTGGKLKEAVGVDVEILGWDSSKPFRENFNDLLKRVKKIAKKDDEIVLVATSLGCYYARAIAENEYCELNLFNPCFKPWELTDIIPPEISKTYDYEFNKSIGIAMAIFVSEEDEVIPNNVESVKEMFGGRCYIEVTKEKHRIESFEKYKDKILDTSFFLRNDMLSVDEIFLRERDCVVTAMARERQIPLCLCLSGIVNLRYKELNSVFEGLVDDMLLVISEKMK